MTSYVLACRWYERHKSCRHSLASTYTTQTASASRTDRSLHLSQPPQATEQWRRTIARLNVWLINQATNQSYLCICCINAILLYIFQWYAHGIKPVSVALEFHSDFRVHVWFSLRHLSISWRGKPKTVCCTHCWIAYTKTCVQRCLIIMQYFVSLCVNNGVQLHDARCYDNTLVSSTYSAVITGRRLWFLAVPCNHGVIT